MEQRPKSIMSDDQRPDYSMMASFETPFDNPKQLSFMSRIVSLADNDSIVLDFFSGSATTAHSVIQLNSEDNGHRKYICVQLPEETDEKSEAFNAGYKNICEIGKERIRRAGEKILGGETSVSQKDGTKVPAPDVGFKVFKLDSSNIKAWDPESDNLEQNLWDSVENIKSDRSSEDLMYEILLKYGLDLTLPIEELTLAGKKVYVVGLGALVICLDEAITLDTVEAIAALKEKYESDDLMRVVFRDNGFKDAEVKTNAIQILKQSGIDDVKSL
jgi:adenine-specific DNA-methyltransferase